MLGWAVHEQRATRRDRVDLTTAKLQQRVAGKRHAAAQHACGAEPGRSSYHQAGKFGAAAADSDVAGVVETGRRQRAGGT